MYKTKSIQHLSEQLESGVISPNECLNYLSVMMFERQELKERCEALNTLNYIKSAKIRSEKFTAKSDVFLEIKQAWRDASPLNNSNVIDGIKYTKAFEAGLIDVEKLNNLNVVGVSFSTVMNNLKELIK